MLKGRNMQEWRFCANVLWKWNQEIHNSAGRYLREMMWDESFNWQNSKERVKKLLEWERERRERGEQAVVALPDSPENLSQIQEEVRLLETDMCVKEVEGAQGQESPYRQEKACGGDGGGWRCRVSAPVWRLFAQCMYKFTHTYMFLSTAVHTYMLPFANQSRTYMQHCSEQEKENGAPGFKCDQMWMCLENRKHTVYTKPGEKKGLVVHQYVGLFQMPLWIMHRGGGSY